MRTGWAAFALLMLTVQCQSDINTRIHAPGYCMMMGNGDASTVGFTKLFVLKILFPMFITNS